MALSKKKKIIIVVVGIPLLIAFAVWKGFIKNPLAKLGIGPSNPVLTDSYGIQWQVKDGVMYRNGVAVPAGSATAAISATKLLDGSVEIKFENGQKYNYVRGGWS